MLQRIAIVDPSENSRERLRAMLLGVDFVWLEADCARYEYFQDVIAQSMPDLVLVALDADRNKALNMISQLSADNPKLPILTISSDHQALLQSLQRGAKYFLTEPLDLQDLLNALRRALNESGSFVPGPGPGPERGGGVQPQASSVLAILGTRGGVGCTSLGVHLGATLAQEPGNNVCLVDLDLALGDADVLLDARMSVGETLSLADLARQIERIELRILKQACVKYPDLNLSLLRHPTEMHEIGVIHEDHIARILNLLKVSYNFLVLDLTKSLLPTDLTGLRMADVILLVAELELSSLRNVVRLLHTLQVEDNLADKVRVVVNKVRRDAGDEQISLKKAEQVIGRPIFWQIPYDPKPITAARLDGAPLAVHGPKSRLQQSLVGLAGSLLGRAAAPAAPGRGGFFGFGR